MKQVSRSLATQLSRTLVLTLAIAWLAVASCTALYVRHVMNQRLDAALQTSAQRMLDLMAHEWVEQWDEARSNASANPDATTTMTQIQEARPFAMQSEGVSQIYQVMDTHGSMLFRSSDAPATPVTQSGVTGFSDTDRWRIYTLKHPSMPLTMHTAESMRGRQDHLLALTLGLLLPLLGLLPPVAFLIHRVSRRALKPVASLSNEIQHRGSNDLAPLAGHDLPLELQTITDSTNLLLLRLSQALSTERQMAANAAHELRTPLATARLRLQAALDQCPPGAAADNMAQAIESLQRLAQRTEKLLQFSRAEDSSSLNRGPVDLGRLAAAILEEFWGEAALRERLELEVLSDDPVVAQGDFDALGIALHNLVENALRHAGPAARVRVRVIPPATLTVSDDGPGVAPSQLGDLGQRRVKHSSLKDSYGLGLSIVSTIADRHGGQLSLASPPAGQSQGFEARLDLLASAGH